MAQKDTMTQNDNPRPKELIANSSYEGPKLAHSQNGSQHDIDDNVMALATKPILRYYLRSKFC